MMPLHQVIIKLEVIVRIIYDNTKIAQVLATKRGESKYEYVAHKFESIGGKVEIGESEDQAPLREIWEGLGAETEITVHLMRAEHVYPDFAIKLSGCFYRLLGGYRITEHEALV